MNANEIETILARFRELGAYIRDYSEQVGERAIHGVQFANTNATDEHALLLRHIPELRAVGFEGTKITNAALVVFSQLKQLESLDLDRTQIDDDGLAILYPMTWLEFLHIDGTRVTKRGVESLQAHLPQCQIVSRWT